LILQELPPQNYLLAFPAFFSTIGGFFFNPTDNPETLIRNTVISSVIGLIVFLLFIRNMKKKVYPDDILLILLFLLATIISIGFYRGLSTGPQIAFTSRYKMYACYFIALALPLSPAALKNITCQPQYKYTAIIACLLVYLASFALNLPYARTVNAHLRSSLEYWVEDGDFRRAKGYFIRDTDSYLFPAIHRRLWNPLVLIDAERVLQDIQTLPSCPGINTEPGTSATPSLTLRHINRNAPGIRLELSGEWSVNPPASLLLCSARGGYRIRLSAQQVSTAAYPPVLYIPAASIAPGHYQLYYQAAGHWYKNPNPFIRKANTR
jgi:hypothetical protein